MKKIIALIIFLFATIIIHAQTSGATSPKDTSVYYFAEQMPVFPGAENAFSQYLSTNIKYPEAEKQAGITGTVYISFTVEKDGSITNIHAVKEVNGAPGFTAEAIRVISAMPKWTPGEMNGTAVRVTMTQPIKFVLSNGVPGICGVNKTAAQLGNVYNFSFGREPKYPGGNDSLQKKILKSDSLFLTNGTITSGKIIVLSFIIDTSGQLCNLFIEKNLPENSMVGNYVAGIFCSMPKWIPGGYGAYRKVGSSDVNTKLYADVFLGEYENGKIVKVPSIVIEPLEPPAPPTAPGSSAVAKAPEAVTNYEMPTFPGGDMAYQDYIDKNLIYPAAQQKMHKEGIIKISLIVETDGSVSSVKAVNAIPGAPEFSAEAIRLITNMPKWIPGKINGKPAQIPMQVEVKFKLK